MRTRRAGVARVAWLALLACAACERTRVVPVRVAMCGELCGESTPRAPSDFTGMECAIAARIRVFPEKSPMRGDAGLGLGGASGTDGAAIGSDRCISFLPHPVSGAPSPDRLADLFDTNASGGGRILSLGRLDPGVPFYVEVSLYGPGSTPCQDWSPLLALGRSGLIDVRRDSVIAVPLGCRTACDARPGISLMAQALETSASMALPDLAAFGEIFPYEALTDTDGVCAVPRMSAHRGEFRPFAVQQDNDRMVGEFSYDRSRFGGCVAAVVARAGVGTTYACLGELNAKAIAPVAFASDAHVQRLVALNATGDATNGVLAIRVEDPIGSPAAGARVHFGLFTGGNEATYIKDAAWSDIGPGGGTTTAGNGIALFTNAPTGPYTVTFAGGATKTFNAGGAFAIASVTTVVVPR
jgi:hypothetical protein